MLLYTALWGALVAHFPDAIQVEQELMFPFPTYAGEAVTIHLEVLEIESASGRARISTKIVKPDGNLGCDGLALLQLPAARKEQ
jgi:acyl dehydratase